MLDALRKRGRETEVLLDSNEVREFKRFNGEETDLFRHFPLLDKTPAEEQSACSEDVVCGVMRILEEEMSTTCSTFDAPISADNSSASAISRGYESQSLVSDSGIDLCYLLEASDDDLGIPSGPVLDLKDEFCQFPKETFSLDGLSEKPDLRFQGENWDFKNDFENYQQFALYEDCWDASEVPARLYKQRFCQPMHVFGRRFFCGMDIGNFWLDVINPTFLIHQRRKDPLSTVDSTFSRMVANL